MAEDNKIEKVDPVTGELMVPVIAEDDLDEWLAGSDITPADLTRVRVPSGGGEYWIVGDGEPAKMIEGVIIYHRLTRTFWEKPYEETGGGTRPDCINQDLRNKPHMGVGTPGGDCNTCPKNRWDSGPKGRGKACTESHLLFVMREDEELPIVLIASPGSLAAIRSYMVKLKNRKLLPRHVLSRFALERVANTDNIPYSRILPMEFTALGAEGREAADRIAHQHRGLMETIQTDRSEVDGLDNLTGANDGYHHMADPDDPSRQMTEADREYLNALGRVRDEATAPPWDDGPESGDDQGYTKESDVETPVVSELRESVEQIAMEEAEKAKPKRRRARKSALTIESLEQLLGNNQWTMVELCGVILNVKDWESYEALGGDAEMAGKKFQEHLAGKTA